MRQILAGLSFLCLTLLVSCAGKVSPELYDRSFNLLKESAQASAQKGDYLKTYVVADFLVGEDPKRTDIYALKAEAVSKNPEFQKFEDRGILGSNLQLREKTDAGVAVRVISWPLNVVLDLLDLVTVEVGGCLGAGVKAQITDAVGVGAQLSAGQTVLGFRNRDFGTRVTAEEYLDIIFFELRTMAEGAYNTGGAKAISYSGAGVKKPSDPQNQTIRDYWAVGAQAEAGIIAVNLQIHPLQFWDFFATLLFFDPLHDNVGSTRDVHFDDDEISAAKYIMRGKKD